jgi:SAM-dependent methyltransferase
MSSREKRLPIEACPVCGAQQPVREALVSWVRPDEPHRYERCTVCGLLIEDPSFYGGSFDASQVEPETWSAEDNERFRRTYVEGIDISDAEGVLYPAFDYVDSGAMVDRLFERVNRHLLHLDLSRAFRVLEVGCATGFLLRRIQAAYPLADVLGIDPSPVSCAKAAAAGTAVLQGTLTGLDLGDRQFDVVVILGNLMLHEDPAATLARARRQLAPHGIIVFDVKNPRSAARLIGQGLYAVPQLRNKTWARSITARAFTNVRYAFGKPQVRRMTSRLGLRILEWHTEPPRVLAFANRHRESNGLRGTMWRALDAVDRVRDERAWLEVCCCRADSSSLPTEGW